MTGSRKRMTRGSPSRASRSLASAAVNCRSISLSVTWTACTRRSCCATDWECNRFPCRRAARCTTARFPGIRSGSAAAVKAAGDPSWRSAAGFAVYPVVEDEERQPEDGEGMLGPQFAVVDVDVELFGEAADRQHGELRSPQTRPRAATWLTDSPACPQARKTGRMLIR